MSVPKLGSSLWELTIDEPEIDVDSLAGAIRQQLDERELDYRTRLLIRRGAEALQSVWGRERFERWRRELVACERLDAILRERFDEEGFPSLAKRVVVTTKPEAIEQYLRELGTLVTQPTKLVIGGSIAAIMPGLLGRRTEDIDVPDEVPEGIRGLAAKLDDLADRYGLKLTHFQSHYLPEGWQERLHWLNEFGNLSVYLIDPYDLFVGKLFSRREKDRDDLRVLSRSLDKGRIRQRAREAQPLWADSDLKEAAEQNWYILYGELFATA